MRWHNTLDDIFGSAIKTRLLRVLSKTRGTYTGRELARLVGYSHTHTNSALAELEINGLVIKRKAGNSYLYSLNEDSILLSRIIDPAFRIEQGLLQDLANALFEGLGRDLISIILFGSVAKGEERADSDVDLILVVRDDADLDKLEEKVSEISLELAISFGSPISSILVTESEYASKKRLKRAFWRDVAKDGIELAPVEREETSVG
jgi:predicted nucleotidyltransferase/biotin operon repressor